MKDWHANLARIQAEGSCHQTCFKEAAFAARTADKEFACPDQRRAVSLGRPNRTLRRPTDWPYQAPSTIYQTSTVCKTHWATLTATQYSTVVHETTEYATVYNLTFYSKINYFINNQKLFYKNFNNFISISCLLKVLIN